jgi:hypothetical protein
LEEIQQLLNKSFGWAFKGKRGQKGVRIVLKWIRLQGHKRRR